MALVASRLPGFRPTEEIFATPEAFTGPGTAWLVGYDDGRAVCCGGLRPLAGDGVGEIKRMFVSRAGPQARARPDAAGRARAPRRRERLHGRAAVHDRGSRRGPRALRVGRLRRRRDGRPTASAPTCGSRRPSTMPVPPARARSSVGERSLHTREVAGSKPAAPILGRSCIGPHELACAKRSRVRSSVLVAVSAPRVGGAARRASTRASTSWRRRAVSSARARAAPG